MGVQEGDGLRDHGRVVLQAAMVAGFQCAAIDAYVFLFPAIGGAFFYEQF